jgi:hypothetical protein
MEIICRKLEIDGFSLAISEPVPGGELRFAHGAGGRHLAECRRAEG